MIVHGKRDIWINPAGWLKAMRVQDDGWSFLLALCQLAQALIDHESGDQPERATDLRRLLHQIVREAASAAMKETSGAGARKAILEKLEGVALPDRILAREPEGFSHYDVHPQAWVQTGQALASPSERIVVIGLRSIGLALGACVAAGCDALLFETFRPLGHPFARRISVAPDLASRLLSVVADRFIIVDEGPGLSGSSVAACVTWLEERGVSSRRIEILASHDGAPGLAGDHAVRAAWRRVHRRPAPQSGCELDGGPARWFAHVAGPCVAADVSAGRWRVNQPRFADAPVDGARERRKILLRAGDGRAWLARFIGLGSAGEATLRRAKRLAENRLIPPIVSHARGYALTAWHANAERPALTLDFAQAAGLYLGRRAALLDGAAPGASLSKLAEMTLVNLAEAFGEDLACSLSRLRDDSVTLEGECRPVEQDGRVQPWEWLQAPHGVIKIDAIDHCASHDLIGAQDAAWDLAGFMVEFGMELGRNALRAGESAMGRRLDPDLLNFMKICWIGFETGLCLLALTRVDKQDAPAHWRRLAFLRQRLDEPDLIIRQPPKGKKELTFPPDV